MSWLRVWSSLVLLLLCFSFSSQNKTQELHVTCVVSRACILPCSFPPSSPLKELLWSRQDSPLLRLIPPDNLTPPSPDDPLSGRAAIFTSAVAKGNVSLLISDSAPRDRGRYSCRVKTEGGEKSNIVIVKVEAPIRSVSVELSRLSGYEEVKCSVRNVFPPPHVTWSTEPQTFQDLRPVTRKTLDQSGLYTVDSRLRTLSQTDLIYVCRATSPYGGEWTASYRHRELHGFEGKDLTLPCFAPSFLNSETLSWTFKNSEDPKHILTVRVQSGGSVTPGGLSGPVLKEWAGHVELDQYRVQFGDGSLELMDLEEEKHSGRYSCVFTAETGEHTERLEVTISGAEKRSAPEESSYWWILGIVVAVLVLALVAMLVYFKIRGGVSKPRSDPEEATELHPVKDSSVESPLSSSGGTNGQSASALT